MRADFLVDETTRPSNSDNLMQSGYESNAMARPTSSDDLMQVANDAQLALAVMGEGPMDRDPIMSSIEDSNIDPSLEDSNIDPSLESMLSGKTSGVHNRERPVVEPLTPDPVTTFTANGAYQADAVDHLDTIEVDQAAFMSTPRQNQSITAFNARKSQTPKIPGRKSATPKTTPGGRAQRANKEGIAASPTGTLMDDGPKEDKASLELAIKLQIEEHGLRRRSR